jgi:type IV pilus assembly protein PilY1
MTHSIFRKLSYLLISFSVVTSSGATTISDDTEIYFSEGAGAANVDQTILPNVLFILDTSGSMTSSVPEAGGDSRITVLKDAMRSIITDAEDMNLGLMRFTSGEGGPVLFPISYIDDDVGNVVSEQSVANELSYTTSINDGLNDGEENDDGAGDDGEMSLSDTVIEVSQTGVGTAIVGNTAYISERVDGGNRDAEEDLNDGSMSRGSNDLDARTSGSTELVGVVFRDIDIPDNSIIEHAYLDFRIRDYKSSLTNIRIEGFDEDNPSDFSNTDYDISSRDKTTASEDWNGVPAVGYNTQVTSVDIKDIVQEIVSRNCANAPAATPDGTNCTYANDRMGFILTTTTGERSFRSRNDSSNRAPRLRVEYTVGSVVATAGDEQIVGLRFDDIKIPQGATVTNASLVFTPTDGNDTNTTWDIRAENDATGNSDDFSIAAHNFSTRTQTGVAQWNVPDWTVDVPVETQDGDFGGTKLKDIVQTAVNNANWCGGNSMSFFITNPGMTAAELREFYSYENNSALAVKFNYSYTSGTGSCYAASESAQASLLADDAEQNGVTVTTNGTDLSIGTDTVGVRFQGIDVPVDATISQAFLQFYAKNTDSSAASFTIKGELPADGDSNIFTSTDNDITSRTYTTGVTWAADPWDTTGEIYSTVDISSIVAQMVASGNNWASGNDMGFVIEPGTGTRTAESYDSNAAFGPRLRIVYQDTAPTAFKTVRERLIEVIDDLPASGLTPVTETLYEAARYWRGENVDYGRFRQNSSSTRISHPGSYCTESGGVVTCSGADVNDTSTNPDTDQYGVYTGFGCDPSNNLNDYDCRTRFIKGNPQYVSPFSSELTCQNNYQVLLTDGSANSANSTIHGKIKTMIGSSSCLDNNSTFKSASDSNLTYNDSEDCAISLSKFLREEDQSTATVGTNLASDQTVKSYTIGFNLGSSSGALANKQFLTDIATVGDGEYFDATTAGSLVDVFNTILTDVKSDPTSFAAPSIAVNTFNRLFSRDEIYFGLFTPNLETRWEGNMKKYTICTDSDPDDVPSSGDECTLGVILDSSGVEAVVSDPAAIDNGEFTTSAISLWTNAADSPDGRIIDAGGAGGEITDYTDRIIYTDINNSGTAGNGTLLSATGFKITDSNWTGTDTTMTKVRESVCTSVDTPPDAACIALMNWTLGKDEEDEDEDGDTTDVRWWFSDVLHSSPKVVTYGFDSVTNKFIDKVLVASNVGGLHLVNGDSGIEEWSFMPNSLLTKQASLKLNATANHTYGLDSTPIIHIEDVDKDGTIETADGDEVQVFVSQRRGGTSVFALDISANVTSASDTSTVIPKFLWRIDAVDNSGGALDSAEGNFSRLGQTWSEPVVATIKTTSGAKEVLMFAGGYDDTLDDLDAGNNKKFGLEGGTPNQGNAIYIVDKDTGKLIFWISHASDIGNGIGTGSGADIEIVGMNYAIPSNLTVLDTNGDGFDNRIYVGDTAGKIWRVDLGADIDPSLTSGTAINSTGGPQGSTVVGHFADLSTAGVVAEERRIFYRPAVVQVKDTTNSSASGGEYDYVVVTTGNRANPLATETADRLYALRDSQTGAIADTDNNNIADDYPLTIDGSTNSSTPIDNNDLVGITLGTGLTGTPTEQDAEGWYLDFDTTGVAIDGSVGNTDGEKGLSAPRVLFGTILFSTYVPEDTSALVTGSAACEAQVGDGRAFNIGILSGQPTLDWDGDPNTNSANDAVITLGAGGIPPEVVTVYTQEGATLLLGKEKPPGSFDNSPIRTYWYQE